MLCTSQRLAAGPAAACQSRNAHQQRCALALTRTAADSGVAAAAHFARTATRSAAPTARGMQPSRAVAAPVDASREVEGGSKPPLKVVIAGAGIGGLVLAVGLLKRGFEVTVLERDMTAIRGEGKYRGPIQVRLQAGRLAVDLGFLQGACQRRLPTPGGAPLPEPYPGERGDEGQDEVSQRRLLRPMFRAADSVQRSRGT